MLSQIYIHMGMRTCRQKDHGTDAHTVVLACRTTLDASIIACVRVHAYGQMPFIAVFNSLHEDPAIGEPADEQITQVTNSE